MSDPFVVIVALLFSGWITGFGESREMGVMLLVALALAIAPWTAGAHAKDTSTLRVLARWGGATLLVLFGAYVTHQLHAPPVVLLGVWLVTAAALLVISHRIVDRVAPSIARATTATRTAAIVGASGVGTELAKQFRTHPTFNTRVVGFFEDRAPARTGLKENEFLGSLDKVADVVKQRHIDVVYIALPMASQPRILKLLRELRDTTASIYFVPDIFISELIHARLSDVDGIPTLAVCETPFDGANRVLKRTFDLMFAAAMCVVAAPLMALIGIAVKLDSAGPILFKQRRYGIDGREIIVYKFRSMTVCEDGDQVAQAVRRDPRVTRLGAVLRRLSLDELPQLFNVLQGRMSLVGPRPHAVAHNEAYRQVIDGYMLRHKVLPGLTGLAQIRGCRGETATVDSMRRRVRYDLTYLSNWSVQLDLYILAATAFQVWRDPASY